MPHIKTSTVAFVVTVLLGTFDCVYEGPYFSVAVWLTFCALIFSAASWFTGAIKATTSAN